MKRSAAPTCVWSRARRGNAGLGDTRGRQRRMFERFKNRSDETNGNTAVAERPTTADDEPANRTGATTRGPASRAATAGGPAVATREHMRTVRARQRDEYG